MLRLAKKMLNAHDESADSSLTSWHRFLNVMNKAINISSILGKYKELKYVKPRFKTSCVPLKAYTRDVFKRTLNALGVSIVKSLKKSFNLSGICICVTSGCECCGDATR